MSRAVGQLTRDNFLDLLKSDKTKNKQNSNNSSNAAAVDVDSAKNDKETRTSKGWKALAENYYEGNKFSLKDWDKEEESSEEENEVTDY